MASHLLSVVMPTHNRPRQLERAAWSLLDQTGSELELVIVDDASSDGTLEVAERLATDPRVRVVHNSESMGPGGSRNRGMEEARGDLLGFCDDDDAWLPGAVEAVVGRFDTDDEVGVLTAWHQVVHDRTGRTAPFRGPLDYGADELLWFNFVALPFGVIRRVMFDSDLAVDTSLPSCEDWDLWLRCAQTRPIATIPEALYAYHQHGGGRVTRVGSAPAVGRQRFLDKHASSMTSACRMYHELVVAQLEGGHRRVLTRLAGSARNPVAGLQAGALLAAGATASAVGIRRGDPGLPARMMANLLRARAGGDRRTRGSR